jgi:hypothetical protein
MTVTATCHCGAVTIEVPVAPEAVTSCNCSICRRIGALWAYYPPQDVRVTHAEGAVDGYSQGDRSLTNWRCHTCGCATHWTAIDPDYDRMAVNARLMPPEIVSAARIRRFDGADTWTFPDEVATQGDGT